MTPGRGAARPAHADMELAPPPQADFEVAQPEIATPPPADAEAASPEIDDDEPDDSAADDDTP